MIGSSDHYTVRATFPSSASQPSRPRRDGVALRNGKEGDPTCGHRFRGRRRWFIAATAAAAVIPAVVLVLAFAHGGGGSFDTAIRRDIRPSTVRGRRSSRLRTRGLRPGTPRPPDGGVPSAPRESSRRIARALQLLSRLEKHFLPSDGSLRLAAAQRPPHSSCVGTALVEVRGTARLVAARCDLPYRREPPRAGSRGRTSTAHPREHCLAPGVGFTGGMVSRSSRLPATR